MATQQVASELPPVPDGPATPQQEPDTEEPAVSSARLPDTPRQEPATEHPATSVAMPPATSQPAPTTVPPSTLATVSATTLADQLLNKLLVRLQGLGVTRTSEPPAEPAQETQPWNQRTGQQWQTSDQRWDQTSWDRWYSDDQREWSSWNKWETREDTKRDRPYISHLEFPTFDGRKESYAAYRYQVMNLKSQCAPKDYKYLAPILISNFTGVMGEDARAMELNGID